MRRGELRQAVADFDEAYQLFSAAGQEFVALQVRHNLGWAAANLGQLPQALTILDENCQAFLRLGHDASLPLVSRAEVLLSAGLSADALDLADEALRRLGAEGDRATAAEAWLLRAQAARLDGDAIGAAEAAEQARRAFAEMGSVGRQRAAELELMQARRAIDARQLGMSELLRARGPRRRVGGGRQRQRGGVGVVTGDGRRHRPGPDRCRQTLRRGRGVARRAGRHARDAPSRALRVGDGRVGGRRRFGRPAVISSPHSTSSNATA